MTRPLRDAALPVNRFSAIRVNRIISEARPGRDKDPRTAGAPEATEIDDFPIPGIRTAPREETLTAPKRFSNRRELRATPLPRGEE